jgi:hypothetical protein
VAAAPALVGALGSPRRVKIALLANRRVPLLRSHPNSKKVLREGTEQLKTIQGTFSRPMVIPRIAEADKFIAHLYRPAAPP